MGPVASVDRPQNAKVNIKPYKLLHIFSGLNMAEEQLSSSDDGSYSYVNC